MPRPSPFPALMLALGLTLLAALPCAPPEPPPADPGAPAPAATASPAARVPDVAPDFPDPSLQRLGAPRAGEWRATFAEPGQTLAEYLASPRRPTPPGRRTIRLVPLGPGLPGAGPALQGVAGFCRAFFQVKVEVVPAAPLPTGALHPSRSGLEGMGQVDAAAVLPALPSSCGEAAACLALTGADLFVDPLAFVFGLSSLRGGVGVVSPLRLRGPGPSGSGGGGAEVLRLWKVAVHELGHQFSLGHCTFYRCVMNGMNSRGECDRTPLLLCPVDLAKVRRALDLDPTRHHSDVSAMLQSLEATPEKEYHRRMARRYGATPLPPTDAPGR